MQPFIPPEIGKTYRSLTDPAVRIYIESVEQVEPEELGDLPVFIITGCAPEDVGDMSGSGFEFINDEWIEMRFIPLAHP